VFPSCSRINISFSILWGDRKSLGTAFSFYLVNANRYNELVLAKLNTRSTILFRKHDCTRIRSHKAYWETMTGRSRCMMIIRSRVDGQLVSEGKRAFTLLRQSLKRYVTCVIQWTRVFLLEVYEWRHNINIVMRSCTAGKYELQT